MLACLNQNNERLIQLFEEHNVVKMEINNDNETIETYNSDEVDNQIRDRA